jgi:hypothetical protein
MVRCDESEDVFWDILTFENEGIIFFRNVDNHLPVTVSYFGDLNPSCSFSVNLLLAHIYLYISIYLYFYMFLYISIYLSIFHSPIF